MSKQGLLRAIHTIANDKSLGTRLTPKESYEYEKSNAQYREAVIEKIDLTLKDSKGWFVRYTDNSKPEWVYNVANPKFTPLGRVIQSMLIATEELKVHVLKDSTGTIRAIHDYINPSNTLIPGSLQLNKGESEIQIAPTNIKIETALLEITNETQFDGNIIPVYKSGGIPNIVNLTAAFGPPTTVAKYLGYYTDTSGMEEQDYIVYSRGGYFRIIPTSKIVT